MEVEVECLQEKTSAGGCTEVGYFELVNSKHETANIHCHQSHRQGDARNLHVCVCVPCFASLCLVLEQAAQYSLSILKSQKELFFVQTSCLESFLVDIVQSFPGSAFKLQTNSGFQSWSRFHFIPT